jgi:hypothetical protein
LRFVVGLICGVMMVFGAANAATLFLLPAVGTSVTFTVMSHSDAPSHDHGSSHGYRGFHGGGWSGGGGPGDDYSSDSDDLADFLRDQSGTLTLTRISSGVRVTTNGKLDSFYSPLAVTHQGTIDPGGPPERFIVAFDNAEALAAGMHAQAAMSGTWNATLNFLLGPDTLQALSVTVQASSLSDNDVKMQGTGEGNLSLSSPMGEQPTSVNVTVNAEVAAGQLRAYTQKVVQTTTRQGRTVTRTTTTSLTAAPPPTPSPAGQSENLLED